MDSINDRLLEHIEIEEERNKATTAALNSIALSLERVLIRLEHLGEKSDTLEGRVDMLFHPETGVIRRVQVLEDSIKNINRLAGWFFSGGLMTFITSLVFMWLMLSKLSK